MLKQIKIIFNTLLDKRCFICGIDRVDELICGRCHNFLIETDNSNNCPICKHPIFDDDANDINCKHCSDLGPIYFDSFEFIHIYDKLSKNLMGKWKFENNFLVNHLFFNLIKDKLDKNIPVTVVPDFLFNKIKRGNSSLYYLLKLLNKEGFKTIKDIYKKKFSFIKQRLKTKKDRFETISKSYIIEKNNIGKYGDEIYLIDDLYTTGNTANYGAKLLKNAGFTKVYVITFFRAIME